MPAMKLSFMTWVCPEWSLSQILTAAIRYGYEGVEPRAEANQEHGIELDSTKKVRKQIRQQFADCGVEISAIATSRRYAIETEHELTESIELTKRLAELAADVGTQNLRVFGGATPERMDFADAKKLVAESLHECATCAADHGVYLCLETHDSYSLSSDCVETVRMADHPNVAISWDIMHPYRHGESIEEAFDNVRGFVRHCHVHDAARPADEGPAGWQIALMGEGDIPHDEAVKLLAGIDFAGYLSGEWIKSFPPEEILPHDARVLDQYRREAVG